MKEQAIMPVGQTVKFLVNLISINGTRWYMKGNRVFRFVINFDAGGKKFRCSEEEKLRGVVWTYAS